MSTLYMANEAGFDLFDYTHLLWLLICFVVTFIGCYYYSRSTQLRRKWMKYGLTYGLLLLEAVKIMIVIQQGRDILYYLPIHLCGLAMFVMLIYSHTRNRYSAEILYAVTLPGAAIALITPGWANEEVMSFLHIHSFIFHIIILMFPLMLIISREHQPRLNQLISPIIFLTVVGPSVYVFNKVAETNYMFLNWPISGTPIMNLAQWLGEPGYIFGMVLVLFAVWIILYTPECIRLYSHRKR